MAKQTFNVNELIDEISPRLGMYIGEQTLEKLTSYIWGYQKAMFECGVTESPVLDFLKFTSWVRKKYKYDFSAEVAGASKTILAISLGIPAHERMWMNFPPTDVSLKQHEESVRLFIALVREFIKLEKEERHGKNSP